MKVFCILILFMFTSCLGNPKTNELYIIAPEPIKQFDSILFAFMKVESGNRDSVVNSKGYTGVLQIGKVMVDEANRICRITKNPSRFTYSDRLDSVKSVRIWYIVQSFKNPTYDLQKAAVVWNPGASEKYINKIKSWL